MRAEPDKLKGRIIRLSVDQNEIGSDVAVAVIALLAAARMIEIPSRQWPVLRQDGDGFEKAGHRGAWPAVRISRACNRGESGWCI
jgi:hypothetical protein